MFLWTSLPSFSKSTQREHSIITVEKGISVDQPKTLLPLSNHCFSQTSELDKRRCILSEVVPESAFKYYCDLFNHRSYQNSGFDVFVLDIQIFSSYGDRSQISQMKVTDGWGTVCCHHSAKKGSTWLQVILLSYGLFPIESELGVGSIHSMKSMAGFSFYHSPDILEKRCVMGEGLFVTIIQW